MFSKEAEHLFKASLEVKPDSYFLFLWPARNKFHTGLLQRGLIEQYVCMCMCVCVKVGSQRHNYLLHKTLRGLLGF